MRARLAEWIASRQPSFEPVAPELALGIHPWPDMSLPAKVELELLDELHPMVNAPHPDLREVVADRLGRLAEVVRYAGLDADVIDAYEQASKTLSAAVPSEVFPQRQSGAVSLALADPIALGASGERHDQRFVSTGTADAAEELRDDNLALALVEAVCRSGSLDLGVNLGVQSTHYSLDRLVSTSGAGGALRRFDDWLSSAEPRVAYLLSKRVFALGDQPTLQDIGAEWGLTRERVRQLEVKARESVDRVFGPSLETAAGLMGPATRYVLPTSRLGLVARLLTTSLANADQVAAALLQRSGPWIHSAGWSYHEILAQAVSDGRSAVKDAADEHGLLHDDAPSHLDGLFASDEDQLHYFRSAMGTHDLNGFWSVRDTLRSRIAAALKRIGRPATKAEIAEMAGLDPDAKVGSTLSAIAGVVRADKERWAYASWVDDPYDGIAGEINQRIDAHAGSVSVASLLDELPRRFGVLESSVMMYLQTPAFVVVEGFVSRAEVGSFNAAPPSKWFDAFRVEGVWGQRVQIEQRHLEGYSLKVRFDIAYANGLRPGCDLKVPIDGAIGEASVIWRAHDASRGIDVGRVSEAIQALGFRAGDFVLVMPTAHAVVIREPVETEAESLATDPVDHHDPLFDLLGDG